MKITMQPDPKLPNFLVVSVDDKPDVLSYARTPDIAARLAKVVNAFEAMTAAAEAAKKYQEAMQAYMADMSSPDNLDDLWNDWIVKNDAALKVIE